MLQEFTNNILFTYAVIFARIGAIMLFIPGFSESYVNVRSRLILAVFLVIVFAPLVQDVIPPMPSNFAKITLIMLTETTIGLFIGLLMRVVQASLHTAGMKIAFMSGLSTATLFDANQSTQGSIVGGYLSVIGITVFFTSGLHELSLRAIIDSYALLNPQDALPVKDFAYLMISTISKAFLIAFQISAPVVIVGLMLYVVAGLMGRLMPNMQVFFVILPVQISVGLLVLGLSLSGLIIVYLNFFEDILRLMIV